MAATGLDTKDLNCFVMQSWGWIEVFQNLSEIAALSSGGPAADTPALPETKNKWLMELRNMLALLPSYILLLPYSYENITLRGNFEKFSFKLTKLVLLSNQIC